jgi:alpha-methylacyl-CoA racemase
VLSMTEAPQHPHNVARGTFAEIGGAIQPMPAPRYSATENATPRPAPKVGGDTAVVLASIGYDANQIAALTE